MSDATVTPSATPRATATPSANAAEMATKTNTGEGRLWGARFAVGPAEAAWNLGVSIATDHRLWPHDIAGSKAHCDELLRIGIITEQDHETIQQGLDRIANEFHTGTFVYTEEDEDIHGAIERRLMEIAGETGGRLRAGRSRNDQVANDGRLWVLYAIDHIVSLLQQACLGILDVAAAHTTVIAPGFTHMQRAQPVTIGHHMAAHAQALARDIDRYRDCKTRLLQGSPLGAGALAGQTLGIDPQRYADALGYTQVAPNSMDVVADRDFMVEFLSTSALLGVHLSRICEEIIWWSSTEFAWVRVADAFSTGSSIMPQKRNPDVAELIRGKTGRLIGDLNNLLINMKGLPLTYNRDMQEDKIPVFDAADTLFVVLPAFDGMMRTLTFNTDKIVASAGGGFALATDVAEALVKVGVPFRQAHEMVGELVASCEARNIDITDLTPAELVDTLPVLKDFPVEGLLDPALAVARRSSVNGPSEEQVVKQIAALRAIVAD